jgi:hypothetical protein
MSHFTIPTNSVNPIDAMHRVSRQSETNVCYTGVRSGMADVRSSELTGLDMWGVGVAILAIWVRLQFTPFLLAQCVECLPLRQDHTYCNSFLNTSITPTSFCEKWYAASSGCVQQKFYIHLLPFQTVYAYNLMHMFAKSNVCTTQDTLQRNAPR